MCYTVPGTILVKTHSQFECWFMTNRCVTYSRRQRASTFHSHQLIASTTVSPEPRVKPTGSTLALEMADLQNQNTFACILLLNHPDKCFDSAIHLPLTNHPSLRIITLLEPEVKLETSCSSLSDACMTTL